jgi:quinol monooxygenase YgiN
VISVAHTFVVASDIRLINLLLPVISISLTFVLGCGILYPLVRPARPSLKTWGIVLSATILGICVAIFAWGQYTTSEVPITAKGDDEVPAFTLAVTVNFKELDDVELFIDMFRDMAQYCRDHEPDTLSYDMFRSDKDPKQVLIFERYRARESYMHHRESAVFKNFRPKFAALGAEIGGMSYVQSNIGYMQH